MAPPPTEDELAAFERLLHRAGGIAGGTNRSRTLPIRLMRRVRELGLSSLAEYHDVLVRDGAHGELEQFVNCLTTTKTSFFRERHHFDFLRDRVFPELRTAAGRDRPRRLRIWSAACSTGEEPYSIAMTAHEHLVRDGFAVQIIASDINTRVLEHAIAGAYTEAQIEDVPSAQRGRYFRSEGGKWLVRDELRAMVEFRYANLSAPSWPITGAFDSIFCRNVLIYFDRATQADVICRLGSQLAPGGYLMLGHSESLFGISDRFTSVGPTTYIGKDAAPAARATADIATLRLGPGALFASREPTRVEAVVSGRVGVCLFDTARGTGGIAHGGSGDLSQALHALVERLGGLGSVRDQLRAKLVAARGSGTDLAREVRIARDHLATARIPVIGERISAAPIELQFFTHTGRLRVRDAAGEAAR